MHTIGFACSCVYGHVLDIRVCFDDQATASCELGCSPTQFGLYLLYKAFAYLLAGVQKNSHLKRSVYIANGYKHLLFKTESKSPNRQETSSQWDNNRSPVHSCRPQEMERLQILFWDTTLLIVVTVQGVVEDKKGRKSVAVFGRGYTRQLSGWITVYSGL